MSVGPELREMLISLRPAMRARTELRDMRAMIGGWPRMYKPVRDVLVEIEVELEEEIRKALEPWADKEKT
jgi:hypothetical protein